MKFQKVSRDQNHIEILNDLGKLGYKVIDLAAVGNSCPDLVVADKHVTALIEVKMPKSQVYIAQLEFLALWPGIAGFAQCTDDVIAIMEKRSGLTTAEKDAVYSLCIEYRSASIDVRPRIRIMEFEKRLIEKLGYDVNNKIHNKLA